MTLCPAAGRIAARLQPRPPLRRLGGDTGLDRRGQAEAGRAARARATLVVQFADLLEALAATPLILQHGPAAVEVVDQYVLDSTRLNPEASRLRDFLQGDPAAILLIEFYGDERRRAAAAACRPGGGAAATRLRLSLSRRHRSRRAGAGVEAPQDGTRALDGPERRCQGDLVRRRHGRVT